MQLMCVTCVVYYVTLVRISIIVAIISASTYAIVPRRQFDANSLRYTSDVRYRNQSHSGNRSYMAMRNDHINALSCRSRINRGSNHKAFCVFACPTLRRPIPCRVGIRNRLYNWCNPLNVTCGAKSLSASTR